MTKPRIAILSLVTSCILYVLVVSGGITVIRADLDYNTHVTRYNPTCEKVRKRYMLGDKQHMTYTEYRSMVIALGVCNAHATPGMTKQWAMVPMK